MENTSVAALAGTIPDLDGNCLFWLDAHFPGADAGMKDYDDVKYETLRLPLVNEIETICQLRKKCKDVLIIDDLRIYEDGPFENGNVPVDALPFEDRNINFIYQSFKKSHVILKSYLDEGYILIFPKTKYRKHIFFNNLFRKTIINDYYLVNSHTSH
jgi:hypothetical protein